MAEQSNELVTRIAVLEARHANLQGDVSEIKTDVKGLRADFDARGQGMTRSEKIALIASAAAIIGASGGVAALLLESGP